MITYMEGPSSSPPVHHVRGRIWPASFACSQDVLDIGIDGADAQIDAQVAEASTVGEEKKVSLLSLSTPPNQNVGHGLPGPPWLSPTG